MVRTACDDRGIQSDENRR